MIFPAQTSRLVLRAWREDDFDAFAAMNADPRVMEYFPAPLTREESAAFFGHIREEFQTEGFGLYAVERISDGSQLGYTGLHRVTFDGLCGQIEVIWRLRADAWGNGYAPEAAQACLALAAKLGRQPALAAGHAENRHGVRGSVQPPSPAGGAPPAAACALLDRDQRIGSGNGRAPQFTLRRISQGRESPATTTPANHRVCGGCCYFGHKVGAASRVVLTAGSGRSLSAAPAHSAAPVPRRPRSGDYFSTKSTVPRMSSDAAPT